jgi:hypothetical protein
MEGMGILVIVCNSLGFLLTFASHHFAGKGPVASTSSKFGHITSYLGPGIYDFRMLSDWLCVAGASG